MTLRELRQQSKKTAAQVAEVLGVAERTVARYEQGIRRLNIEQVIPLAELFDVSEREVIEAQITTIKNQKSVLPIM